VTLRGTLQPLLGVDGLVALLVLTSDGLPVEMFGYGLRAEHLAAEIAGVARATRKSFRALGLGEPSGQRIALEGHNVEIVPVEDHYLAVVADSGRSGVIAPHLLESTLEPLRRLLRGER
jgi:predicted regulator of Ras-like GTPase activity (Roadblock/LC7/MglB family)